MSCAECNNSLPFSGASSIPLCYVLFPATLLHQLFFHPLSPHLAIYFLVYLSILLFPNSYIIPFWEFYFLPFSVHVQTNVICLTVLSLLYSFIPFPCAECDNSLPFSGYSSIPLCYVLFPATLLHQLLSSLTSSCHLFLVLPLNIVVPKFIYNTLVGILFPSTLCTCPNQRNLTLLPLL